MSWQNIVKANSPLNSAEKDYNEDVHAHNLGAGKKMNDQLREVEEILRAYMLKGKNASAEETLNEIMSLQIFNVGSPNPDLEGEGVGASMRGQAHSGGY